MNFYIIENCHWYLPILILPRRKKTIEMTVTFPETSWYDSNVQAGWNKLLRVGKLLHYGDYTTIGWQWMDAKNGDYNVYKGRVLKLAAFYHDDWGFPKWDIFEGNFKVGESLSFEIVRENGRTFWFYYADKVRECQCIYKAVTISGNFIHTPYFGGRSKSQYTHKIKIDWK